MKDLAVENNRSRGEPCTQFLLSGKSWCRKPLTQLSRDQTPGEWVCALHVASRELEAKATIRNANSSVYRSIPVRLCAVPILGTVRCLHTHTHNIWSTYWMAKGCRGASHLADYLSIQSSQFSPLHSDPNYFRTDARSHACLKLHLDRCLLTTVEVDIAYTHSRTKLITVYPMTIDPHTHI